MNHPCRGWRRPYEPDWHKYINFQKVFLYVNYLLNQKPEFYPNWSVVVSVKLNMSPLNSVKVGFHASGAASTICRLKKWLWNPLINRLQYVATFLAYLNRTTIKISYTPGVLNYFEISWKWRIIHFWSCRLSISKSTNLFDSTENWRSDKLWTYFQYVICDVTMNCSTSRVVIDVWPFQRRGGSSP